jgi:dihydrolipoamide dehydrogenase
VEYHLAIIGSGSAGLEAARRGAQAGLKVIVIEREAVGGTSFHRGYYAVRALRACARALRDTRKAERFGLEVDVLRASLNDWMVAQRRVAARLVGEIRWALERLNVTFRLGEASLATADRVVVTTPYGPSDEISVEAVVIATGSRPSFAGVPARQVVNTDQLLKSCSLPHKLAVVGGGHLGCELAFIYRSLGSEVVILEGGSRLLPDWDESVSSQLKESLESQGVKVLLNSRVDLGALEKGDPGASLAAESSEMLEADLTVVTAGRTPNSENFRSSNISIDQAGFVTVDDRMRTSRDNVYAIGDVTGLGFLDSFAVAQAKVAIDSIRGRDRRFNANWVPRCVNTDPPIASVGWTEEAANRANFNVRVYAETIRTVTEESRSVVEPETIQLRLVTDPDSGMLLGCTALGLQAAQVVNAAALLMQANLSSQQLSQITFVHPSIAEALQSAVLSAT